VNTTPREVRDTTELRAAADDYAATPEARAEHTYLGRIQQMADAIRAQGTIGPADHAPDTTTRRRAVKWLSRAYGHIPRPHMEAAHPSDWLSHIVTRIRELEGELYHRLLHVKLDADPLPEETTILHQQRSKVHRDAVPEMLFIPSDWNGPPTLAGDYCLDALLETLDHANRPQPRRPHPRKRPARLATGQTLHARPLPTRGPARRRP